MELYNSVLDHVSEQLCSASTRQVSWPVSTTDGKLARKQCVHVPFVELNHGAYSYMYVFNH